MRGKHGGSRETFIQYHVPEALVYVNGSNLSLKVKLAVLQSLCLLLMPFYQLFLNASQLLLTTGIGSS